MRIEEQAVAYGDKAFEELQVPRPSFRRLLTALVYVLLAIDKRLEGIHEEVLGVSDYPDYAEQLKRLETTIDRRWNT